MIQKAREFAFLAHEGQFRKGAERQPYSTHLEEVAASVAQFGGASGMVKGANRRSSCGRIEGLTLKAG